MKKLVLCVFLAVLIPGAVQAQPFELGVFAGITPHFSTPLLGSLSDSPNNNDTALGHSPYVVGARLTWNTKGYYGNELGVSIQHMGFLTNYATTLSDGTAFAAVLQDKVKVESAFYNFLCYFMPRGERWRPFATVGVQGARYQAPHFSEWPGGGSTNMGFNFGGGVKIKLFKHALFRIDLRENMGAKPYPQLSNSADLTGVTGLTHEFSATAGFSIAF